MAGQDIYVTFGADTGGLESAFALARAQTKSLATELNAAAREMSKMGATAQSDLGQKVTDLGQRFAASKANMSSIRSEMGALGAAAEGVGAAAGHGGTGIGFYARELHYMADELTSGNMRRFQGTLMNVTSTFMLGHTAMIPWIAGIVSATAAIGYFAYSAHEAAVAQGELNASAEKGQFRESVNYNPTIEALTNLRSELSKTAAMTGWFDDGTKDVLRDFDQLGEGGRELAVALGPVAQAMVKAGEAKDINAAYAELLKRFQDLKGAGDKYVNSLEAISPAMKKTYAEAGQQNDVLRMQTTLVQALYTQYPRTTGAIMESLSALGTWTETGKQAKEVSSQLAPALDAAATASGNLSNEARHAAGSLGALAANALVAISRSNELSSTLMADAQKIAATYDPVGEKIKKLQGDIATLNKAGLGGTPSAVAAKDQLTESTQKSVDPHQRDALQQSDDAIKDWEMQTKASHDAVLQKSIATYKAMSTNASLSANERWQAEQKYRDAVIEANNAATKSGDKAGKDQLRATEAALSGQISLIEAHEKAYEDHLAFEVKMKQMTEAQKLAAVSASLKKEQDDVDAIYAQELALDGLTATKKQEIADKLQAFNEGVALKEQEAQEKAAEASAKSWDDAMKKINSAFDSQISGLLTGTESWGTAMKKVFTLLTEDVIKFFVNWGLQEAEKVAKTIVLGNTEVAAHVAGNTAKEASDASAGAAGFAVEAASITKSILASAGEAFAGVFGFLSPVMGPAAAGPAAAAEATVAAMVPSMAVGGYVLSDGLINAHAGETVTPANVATPYAGGGSAGARGVTHNHTWNVSSNSSSPRDVAREVAKLWNANPSMRPAY